jgi:glutamate 5-kinase
VIVDAVAGLPVGTMFDGGEGTIGARKLWILLGGKAVGEIVIDDGACEALRVRHTSLLPAGVIGVHGEFMEGDAVAIVDGGGAIVARGLTDLSSVDLQAVMGLKSAEIVSVLPGVAGRAAVHRDRLVVL